MEEEKFPQAVGYVVALVDKDIIYTGGFDPLVTVYSTACKVVDTYYLASDDDQAEMAYLIVNFKTTNKPSYEIFGVVYKTIYGGHCPVYIREKKFLAVFVAVPIKSLAGGRKVL